MQRRGGGILYCMLVYLFLFLPIVVIVINSFNATTSKPYLTWKGFTFDWYIKLFDNTALLESFGNTIFLAVVSTLLSTVVGTLAAVGMYKYKFRGKSVIDGLLYIPVVIPEIVLGISLLTMFSTVDIPRGMLSLILAHVTFSIPFVIFNIRAQAGRLRQFHRGGFHGSGSGKSLHLLPCDAAGAGAGYWRWSAAGFTLSIDDVIISYFYQRPGQNLPAEGYGEHQERRGARRQRPVHSDISGNIPSGHSDPERCFL